MHGFSLVEPSVVATHAYFILHIVRSPTQISIIRKLRNVFVVQIEYGMGILQIIFYSEPKRISAPIEFYLKRFVLFTALVELLQTLTRLLHHQAHSIFRPKCKWNCKNTTLWNIHTVLILCYGPAFMVASSVQHILWKTMAIKTFFSCHHFNLIFNECTNEWCLARMFWKAV